MSEEKEYKSVYDRLADIDVSKHVEKKNGFNYLSWAWAWDTIMQLYPKSWNTVYETPEGMPYWNDGRTGWVKVGFTLVDENNQALERIEYFPITNYQNKSIPLDKITSFDVNTAIQRGTTKAIARHGLGFYLYAGQDLPNDEQEKYDAEKERIWKECTKVKGELRKVGVDVRSESFMKWGYDNTGLKKQDEAYLNNEDGAKYLEALLKALEMKSVEEETRQ